MPLYFEEFTPGRRWTTPGRTLHEAEIGGFAASYDAQDLHLDAMAAARGPFGGLIASGFHTLAVSWALWLRMGALEGSGRGGIGLDEVRWHLPVRPGDTLRAEVEVLERSLHPSRGRGRVVLGHTVRNHREETVLSYRSLGLVATDPAAERSYRSWTGPGGGGKMGQDPAAGAGGLRLKDRDAIGRLTAARQSHAEIS